MEPTPNASLFALKELAHRATKGPWRSSGSAIEADSLWRLAHTNSYHADWRQNADYIAAASPDVVLGLLQQLAAAEARATEAAAEAGKWQQRHGELQQELAEQEVQTLGLIREAVGYRMAMECYLKCPGDPAPLDFIRQLVQIMAENAPAAPGPAFGPEDGWIADLLRGTIPVEGPPAAPTPVAPQQQEGGGVPTYEEFCALASAGGFVSLPTRSTWDRLTEQGKRDMMPIAAFRPRSL